MEIRDVIENMRVEILSLKLRMTSMRSEQDMIERFLWDLITLVTQNNDIVITFEDSSVSRETEEGEASGTPTLF